MTNGVQNITISALGKTEALFLAKIGTRPTFSIEDARYTYRAHFISWIF
jgi:hypothetical protein